MWSNQEGYPADPNYREFYRDIGYDLPLEYIGPYIHEPEVRVFTGFKYHAITGKGDQKNIYRPELAARKVLEHTENFLYEVEKKGRKLAPLIDRDHPHPRLRYPNSWSLVVGVAWSSPFCAKLTKGRALSMRPQPIT